MSWTDKIKLYALVQFILIVAIVISNIIALVGGIDFDYNVYWQTPIFVLLISFMTTELFIPIMEWWMF